MMKTKTCMSLQNNRLFVAIINRLYAINTNLLVKPKMKLIYYYLISFINNINPKGIIFLINNTYRDNVLALVLPKPLMVA